MVSFRLSVLIIAIGLGVSSCSCLRMIAGRVKDSETQRPIRTAKISVINKGYQRYFEADSTGNFTAYLTGGTKCPRIRVRIEAEGYKPIEIKEPRKRDTVTVYLEKLM